MKVVLSMKRFSLAILIAFTSFSANAATCMLSVHREPCPGKETEAMAPYKGMNPTLQNALAITEGECRNKAEMASKIVRKRIIKKITVTPTFNGSSLSPVFSEDRCSDISKNGAN